MCCRCRRRNKQAQPSEAAPGLLGCTADSKFDVEHGIAQLTCDWIVPDNSSGNLLPELPRLLSINRVSAIKRIAPLEEEHPGHYACENLCGFEGSYSVVLQHEKSCTFSKVAKVSEQLVSALADDVPVVVEQAQGDPFDVGLGRVLELCKAARVFEATTLLRSLQESLETSLRADACKRIASEAALTTLERVHTGFREGFDLIMGPSLRQDVAWAQTEFTDPAISPDCELRFGLRHAEGPEYVSGGSLSQLIFSGELRNFPMTLTQFFLMQCEVDLSRKEWIKDCVDIVGLTGGPAQLHGSCVQVLLAPSLIPFRIQDMFMRSVALCSEAPFANLGTGPGVLVLEKSAPEGVTDFEGWKLPESAKRVVKLSTQKMLYVTPSANSEAIHIKIAVRLSFPLSQWIVPLNLVNRIVAKLLCESMKRIKEMVIDHWQEFEFNDREKDSPEFYQRIREIQQGLVAGSTQS